MAQWQLGIGLPFVIAAVLKTAQGSSTVAIITTAALISPLLEPLGLAGEYAKALVVLAIGAGAMTVSHLSDSYFWVVSQFSDMDTATALRCHTLATLVQGLVGIGHDRLVLKVLLVGSGRSAKRPSGRGWRRRKMVGFRAVGCFHIGGVPILFGPTR